MVVDEPILVHQPRMRQNGPGNQTLEFFGSLSIGRAMLPPKNTGSVRVGGALERMGRCTTGARTESDLMAGWAVGESSEIIGTIAAGAESDAEAKGADDDRQFEVLVSKVLTRGEKVA